MVYIMQEQLSKLVEEGKFSEFKDFIEQNNIDVNAPIDKDDNSLLHIATKELI
ncbi:hypothetical protein NOVO_08510 [Rickettsiales bacterium Ac37b]|nr:hypothetical protein NOVO_08510 [Rickettsiales bacterium Ac37b]